MGLGSTIGQFTDGDDVQIKGTSGNLADVSAANALKVDGSAITQPISAVSLPLPTGAATETTLAAQNVLIGAVTETAPATDTASSGLNGRLQRIAQRITSLIALIPSSIAVAWFSRISDGTNTMAVKAASTAPVATDPAAVVTLSPNGNQSTAALQTTGNSSLSSIDTKLTSQATSTNQTTEISSLQILDDVPSLQNGALVKGTPIMGQLDDASTTAATEDNVAAVRITAQRAAHINFRNNAGTEIGTASAPVRVDPTGTTTQPVSGTVTASVGDGTKATYSASVISLLLSAATTDFFTLTGSGTKTIRITQMAVDFTGGGNLVAVQVVKRSTANTGGTSTTPAAVPHDSSDAAGSATVRAYTVNPTVLGSLVGTIRADRVDSPLLTSTTAPAETVYSFGVRPSKAVVLRGTGEVLAFNLNGATLSGANVSIYIEWTEE